MIRIILVSLLCALNTVKIFAQSPFEIVQQTHSIERINPQTANFKLGIKSKQDSLSIRFAWVSTHAKNVDSLSIADFGEVIDLNLDDSIQLSKNFLNDDLFLPQSLVVRDIISNVDYAVPIPFGFILSEIDTDTPGSDTQEFAELVAPGLPFASLNGLELWAVNGNLDTVSRTFSLQEPNFIADEKGVFTIVGRDLDMSGINENHFLRSSTNLFQNGSSVSDEADAVALVWNIESTGQTFIQDAVIYDVSRDDSDTGLGSLLQMEPIAVNEGKNRSKDEVSIQRVVSDFGPIKDARMFHEETPSPGIAQFVQLEGIIGNNKWMMLGVPEAWTLADWLNPTLYTQGALGADIEIGDSIIFGWTEEGFSPITDLNQRIDPTAGVFVYVTDLGFGFGTDFWPKQLGVTNRKASKRALKTYSKQLSRLNDGLNLVANPYPSPIDLQKLFTQHPEIQSVSIWNGDEKQYQAWNGQTGDLSDLLIAPFEGFWLKMNQEKVVEFSPELIGRTTSNKEQINRHWPQLALNLRVGKLTQRVIIVFQQENDMNTDHLNIEFRKMEADQPLSMYLRQSTNDLHNFKLLHTSEKKLMEQTLSLVIENATNADNLILEIDNQFSDVDLSKLKIDVNLEGQQQSLTNAEPIMLNSKKAFTIELQITSTQFTDVAENVEEKPTKFSLLSNYPNPFNPSTTIRYELKEAADIQLGVFDLNGRLVEWINQSYRAAGVYQQVFSMKRNEASGLYLTRLYVNNVLVDQQKMLFVK